jgi:transcriptional activator of cad operon
VSNISLRNKLARFLACELDCNSGRLSVNDMQQKLEPMVHQFLLLLIQHQGELLSKKTVLETLWPHKDPSDDALRAMVKKAREALQDNARNPVYIKTIPTKGYLLIPPVTLISTVLKSWWQQHTTLVVSIGGILGVLLFLTIGYLFVYSASQQANERVVINKSNITLVQKENVSTYYINGALNKIWIESSDTIGSSQLMVEDITNNLHQKLAFSVPLKQRFWYSQGSQRLLVTRSDGEGFYSVQFSRTGTQPAISQYMVKLPEGVKILSLDFTGNQLFVISNEQKNISLFSLESGLLLDNAELPPALVDISQQIIKHRNQTLLTDTKVRKDFYAHIWPSPVSNGFTVNLGNEAQSTLLYYETLQEGNPTNEFNIRNGLQSAVWNMKGNRFSFTDDDANLNALQILEGRLTSFNANGEVINQVVADCGASCFIIANTQGVPKLSEVNVSFHRPQNTEPLAIDKYAQIVFSNTIARNESLPQYTNRGLYFVSQQGGSINIVFRDRNNVENIVYTFDKQAIIDEFMVDADDNFIAGVVNQRAFMFDLNVSEMRYIPLRFPKVSHVGFSNVINEQLSDTFVGAPIITFYAETSGSGQATNAREPNGMYQYNVNTQDLSLLKKNVKSQQLIELIDNTDKGLIHYKALFTLQNNGLGTVTFQNNKPTITVNLNINDCMACWQIKGNYLYQLLADTNSITQSQMQQINLLTGETVRHPLLFKDLQNQFNLHPTLNKIVVSTRQRLQTKLTQIEGLSQIY